MTSTQATDGTNMAKLQEGDTITVTGTNLANLDFVAAFMGTDIAKVDHFTVTNATYIAGGGASGVQGGVSGTVDLAGEWKQVGNDFTYWDGAAIATVTGAAGYTYNALATDLGITINYPI